MRAMRRSRSVLDPLDPLLRSDLRLAMSRVTRGKLEGDRETKLSFARANSLIGEKGGGGRKISRGIERVDFDYPRRNECGAGRRFSSARDLRSRARARARAREAAGKSKRIAPQRS